MKLSRKICDCAQSPIRKFYPYAVAAQQRGIRIHQLNIGQPDIQTPPAFFEAIEAGRRDVLAYAESPGIPALLEAIRAYYARIGASFETQDILVTTGGSEALLMAMLCILDEGDEVLIPEPYYPNYFTFIRMAGGRVHPIPTSPEDGYRYAERARIEPHITEKTRAILLSNPGNPTGTVLTPAELRLMADIASEHGLYLICDEVYREFIYDGAEPATAGSFRDIDENLILIDSVSKRFSACGARIGACPSPRSISSARLRSTAWIPATSTRRVTNTAAAATPATASCWRSPASSRRSRRARSTPWQSCRWTALSASSSICCRNLKIMARPSCLPPAAASMPRPVRARARSASPMCAVSRSWNAP